MCMSPDEMSDDRIAEIVEYYDQLRQGGSGYYQAQFENYRGLLTERHAARVAEINEAMASVTAEAPVRETVRV